MLPLFTSLQSRVIGKREDARRNTVELESKSCCTGPEQIAACYGKGLCLFAFECAVDVADRTARAF